MLYIDSRFGRNEFDRFRKMWSSAGGNCVDSNPTVRKGSLDRRINYNRYSWFTDEFTTANTFRPITLTVNGFFKQVLL